MTPVAALQFYAPFVDLMAPAFWSGVLTQRVCQLEKGGDDNAHLVSDVDAMKSDLRHMRTSVDGLTDKLSWATDTNPPYPSARRRQRASE